jgi:hypothetical protein
MQSILKGLVIVIFVFSVLMLGSSLMAAYTWRDTGKELSEIRGKVQKAETRKKELAEARAGVTEAEQGLEYWEREYGKSKNANDRRETKDYPELLQGLTATYAQDKTKFDKSEEENIKAGERSLAEKLRTLKDMRVKVQQARVERDKAKADIDALEAQKKELLNRTAQETILLEDFRKRHQEVGDQLKKVGAGAESRP